MHAHNVCSIEVKGSGQSAHLGLVGDAVAGRKLDKRKLMIVIASFTGSRSRALSIIYAPQWFGSYQVTESEGANLQIGLISPLLL